MSFLSALNISGSALTAQKYRMDVISQNIANSNTTKTADGGPYRRKLVVLEEQKNSSFQNVLSDTMQSSIVGGVRVSEVVEDDTPFTAVYNPNHPDANEEGYVMMPNVNSTEEMLDLMSASTAYDANITALNALKAMAASALKIGK